MYWFQTFQQEEDSMYNRPTLELSQVLAGMSAMLDEANKQPDRPVAIAIVDDRGDMITYARMDNCRKQPQKIAITKAYASAMIGVDSQAYIDRLKGQGMTVSNYADPNLGALPGGLVIRLPGDGLILGGIGVSGLPSGAEDEEIARIGLKALNL